VKTNIGHLEAAAGIVGLVKAVLVLQRGEVPPHLHLQHLNSHIAWDSIPIVVPTVTTRVEPNGAKRVAGVSSFGFSGTNAHVILEEAPAAVRPATNGAQRDVHVLAISARDSQALDALVSAYARQLSSLTVDTDLSNFCFTANAGRAHFAHRVSVIGTSGSDMAEALEAFRRGDPHPAIVSGAVAEASPRVAMLFPGQGSQYIGMGRELYDSAPAFREAFDRCADVLDQVLSQPIRSVLFATNADSELLNQTSFAQPAMYAIEVALANLWRSWGINPVAVMGHSFGEYAAACVAGALPLADGARMVATRGRLVQALPKDGAMTVIGASEAAVTARLQRYQGRVAIAAVNGPANTVISGERAAVDALAGEFAAAGTRVTALRISHAFHSPLMDSVLDEFEREVSRVEFADPQTVLISNLSGRVADRALIGTAAYWRKHMREAVRFADSMRALAAHGITHYIEMGPHPVLIGMGSECVQGGAWLPSLREGKPAWPVMLHALQVLYCAGAPVDWQAVDGGMTRRRVALPGYPFQRKRHWVDGIGAVAPAAGISGHERWQRLHKALDRQAQRGPLDLNVTTYPQKWDCLARINRGYAVQVLREAGLFTAPFERHSLDQVLTRAGILTTYRHLVGQWLERLIAVGLLRREGNDYVSDSPLPDPTLPLLWRAAEGLFGDNQPLLAYVRQCGRLLGAVLTGKESPLETLFPGGSFDLADGLYQRSATMRYINSLASTAIEAIAEGTAPGSSLRIMEVGAGTGGTTSSLLPVLPPDRTRYRFTDMSNTFFEQARKRFAEFRFVEYGLFDVDEAPTTQGYAPQSFDLIVSANAVHACTDLRVALRHLHSLLAPGGLLVLVESTTNHEWFDMTTGLIEGWKHFADDLRTDNPLLPAEAWMSALREEGFVDTAAWPPTGSPAEALGQHVIVARVAGAFAASAAMPVGTDDSRSAADSASDAPAWRELLEQSLPGERLSVLQEMVCEQVMRVLGAGAASRPARHDRLMDLGMDSLMAVQLRNALSTALVLESPLPSTLMFDYPTINAIANYLLELLTPNEQREQSSQSAPVQGPAIRSAATIAAMSDEEIAKLL
jgi:malonyl CoA-acyl carrier protein transacylase/SAM-dependent methyltransferase/acyl carrier protein